MAYKKLNRNRVLREWWIFASFVVIAFLFWLFLNLSDLKSRMEFVVLVVPEDVPAGYHLTDDRPEAVKLILSGPKMALMRLSRKLVNDTLKLPGIVKLLPNKDRVLQVRITDEWIANDKILLIQAEPYLLDISLNMLERKLVPIAMQWEGKPKAGIQLLGSIQFFPDQVPIFGKPEILEQIHEISTVSTPYPTDVGVGRLSVPLQIPYGIQTASKLLEVQAQFFVSEMVTKSFLVEIDKSPLPSHLQWQIFPKKVQVHCTLPARLLKESEANWLPKVVVSPLEDIENWNGYLPLEINNLPDFCQLAIMDVNFVSYQVWN